MRQVDAELHRFFARRLLRGMAALVVAVATASIGVAVVHSNNGVDVGRGLSDTLTALAIVFVFLGAALGASFVGADFYLGSLTSQLLYEPRRWHLHLAKATAVALGCAVFAAGLCVVVAALMFVGSALHGVTQGVDTAWWQHRGVELVRAIAACSAAAVMAYAITIVTRRSSAAIVAFLLQYPFILIVSPDARAPFGPLSKVAPLRALLAVAFDPSRSNSAAASGIRTTAGGIALTLLWIVVFVGVSGQRFSRAEIR